MSPRARAAAAGLLALALGSAPAAARAELRAGFAAAPLPAPLGAPLGGYGGLVDRRATGEIDPPEARALVLASERQRVALLALDVVIVRPELRARLEQRLAPLRLDALAVLATHTHSGPGGFIQGWLAERLTSGSYDPRALGALADAGARAVEQAAAELAPARAAAVSASAELARNRRDSAGPRERELPLLALRFPGGAQPVLAFSYGMHPTVRSPANTRYSADYLGPARHWLAAHGWRALYLPGPMGDQGPGGPPEGSEDERAQALGEALARTALAAAQELQPEPDAELELAQGVFRPPPFRLRRFCALWWLSPLVGGAAQRLISTEAPIQAFALGAARLVALPAEPTSALGTALRAGIRARAPGSVPFVLAHGNDWLGYALAPEAYDRGGYEACLSLHGRELGPALVGAALELVDALPAPAPKPAR